MVGRHGELFVQTRQNTGGAGFRELGVSPLCTALFPVMRMSWFAQIADDSGLQLTKWVVQENTLRLKASLERVQRLTSSFADEQLSTFAARASQLGGGLGVAREVQIVFTEAEIRANVAFQLSKLNTDLLQACREQLGMGDYDGIVFGQAVGELVAVDSIQPGQEHAGGRPCVLLVQSATGDEEVCNRCAAWRGRFFMTASYGGVAGAVAVRSQQGDLCQWDE